MEKPFSRHSLSLILVFVNVLSAQTTSSASPFTVVVSGIDRRVYARPGDINIGAIMLLTMGVDELGCSMKMYPNSWNIEYTEAVAFAVNKVNSDTNLLPNVTLGFYILDDCTDRSVALAQALTFLPRNESSCSASRCNETSFLEESYPLSSKYSPQLIPYYDVMGILAPMLSISAVPVSYLMSAAKMPIVGYTTTSDELSDRALHPYYLRVVTSDRYQAIAMLKFISSNGWSYVSVVYSQGTYGERAYEVIKTYAPSYNICIAVSHRVGNGDDTGPVASSLLNYPKARVVILFADEQPVRSLFTSIERMNATGQFIWVCCDSVTAASKENLLPHFRSIVGAFMFIYSTKIVPEFYDFIREQNVSTSPNPWFKDAWESTAQCSFANGTCDPEADITQMVNFGKMPTPSLAMDAVLTFAHGVHNLISDVCPSATGSSVRECIKRDVLLKYLQAVSFKGYTGNIKFSTKNDFQGMYVISQMAYNYVNVSTDGGNNTVQVTTLLQNIVAYYDTSTDSLRFADTNMTWSHLQSRERLVPIDPSEMDPVIPESVCSRPCLKDEYKIQKDACCWECRTCRDNEILVHGNSGCRECDEFTWPDAETDYTSCLPIPLTYPLPSDFVSVILICLAIIAILGTCFVIGSYIYYRETRIMKAASRELSFLQMGGVFVGYITVICFQTKPTSSTCSALYFMFCLSFAWLYSPLLVKAVRIYRIFQSGSKNNRRPRFVSPRSQIALSLLIIFSQVSKSQRPNHI